MLRVNVRVEDDEDWQDTPEDEEALAAKKLREEKKVDEEAKKEEEEEKEDDDEEEDEFSSSEEGEDEEEDDDEEWLRWDEDDPSTRFKAYEGLEDLFEVRAPVTPYQRAHGDYVRLDWEKAEMEKEKAREEEAAILGGCIVDKTSKGEALPSKERYPNATHRLLAMLFNPRFYDDLVRTMEYDMTKIQGITEQQWQTAHVALRCCEDTTDPGYGVLLETEDRWMNLIRIATRAFDRLIPRNPREPPRLNIRGVFASEDVLGAEADLVRQLAALDEVPLMQSLDKIMKEAANGEDTTMQDDGKIEDVTMKDVSETDVDASVFDRQLAALGLADVTHCKY